MRQERKRGFGGLRERTVECMRGERLELGESRERSKDFGGIAVSSAQMSMNCPKETCFLVN